MEDQRVLQDSTVAHALNDEGGGLLITFHPTIDRRCSRQLRDAFSYEWLALETRIDCGG